MIVRETVRSKRAIVTAAMLVACGSSSAWGQGARGTPAPTADRLAAEGRAEFAKGNTQAAVDKLLAAWALDRTFSIAANLGTAELDLGRMRAAAEHLDFALREMPASTEKEKRERLAEYLEKAKAGVGILRLDVDPPDATVSVDGVRVAKSSSAEVYVDPGEHTVVAERDGRTKESRMVKVGMGESKPVSLKLAVPPISNSAPPVTPSPSTAPAPAEDRTPQLALWLVGAGSALAMGTYMTASGAELLRGNTGDHSAGDLLLGLGTGCMALGLGVGVGGFLFERAQQRPSTALWIAPHATTRSAGFTFGARY